MLVPGLGVLQGPDQAVQVVPVLLAVRWDTFYRFIAHAVRCLHYLKDCLYKLLFIFPSSSFIVLYDIVSEFDCTLLCIAYCFDVVVVVVVVQRTKRKTGFLAKYVILLKEKLLLLLYF